MSGIKKGVKVSKGDVKILKGSVTILRPLKLSYRSKSFTFKYLIIN